MKRQAQPRPPLLLALAFALSALPFTSPALAAEENQAPETIQRTFPASAGGKLVLKTDRGSLEITGSDRSDAEVVVTRKVTRASGEKARRILESHEVHFTQDGNTLRVDAEVKGAERWNWLGPNLEVTIQVKLPREFNVDADTAGGSVTAGRLKGELSLRTSGGSLHLESLEGTIKARTSGGSIKVSQVKGTTDLNTSGGSIRVEKATGTHLVANTSGGSIHLSAIEVPTKALTSGGSIQVEGTTAPIDATTSGGSITAKFATPPKEPSTLKTSAGGINVTLPANSAFDLDAATSAGNVRSEIPVATKSSRSGDEGSLKGPANGGGPTLKLRTSAGSIRIKTS